MLYDELNFKIFFYVSSLLVLGKIATLKEKVAVEIIL